MNTPDQNISQLNQQDHRPAASKPSWFLSGHRSPVLCLCQSKDGLRLATGSEDNTCRIWDLSTKQTHKAIMGFEDAVSAVCFDPLDSQKIYVASGTGLFMFSLVTESMIIKIEQATKTYTGAQDEINQISVNDRGTFLTTCDDAGDVRVLDLKTGQWMRRLVGGHDNIAMAVQFVPTKDLQAISGGMDFRILSWDYYKGRATETLKTDEKKAANAPQGSAQVFNPPFVHSIAIHPSGTRAAVGLGDGTIQFLHKAQDAPLSPEALHEQQQGKVPEAKGKKNKGKVKGNTDTAWVVGGRLLDAHFSSLTTVEYLPKAGVLVSAANNGTVAVWDEQESRSAALHFDPAAVLLSREQEERCAEETENDTNLQDMKQKNVTLRAVEPRLEFRTFGVFDRINCLSSRLLAETKEDMGSTTTRLQVFIAGVPHVAEGEDAPQPSPQILGRVAVYEVCLSQ